MLSSNEISILLYSEPIDQHVFMTSFKYHYYSQKHEEHCLTKIGFKLLSVNTGLTSRSFSSQWCSRKWRIPATEIIRITLSRPTFVQSNKKYTPEMSVARPISHSQSLSSCSTRFSH